jgi:hypothetical protein
MTMRREFPRSVREEIVRRAKNSDGIICCEGCSLVLGAKRYEIDHVIAEALVVDKSKPLTAKDGQLLGACCHRGEDGKTAQDVTAIAKAKRRGAKHDGYARRTRNLIAGSRGTKWKRKVSGETVLR